MNHQVMATNVRTRADEVVKRTRSLNVYELSQDLLDKQLELLERKYGGHARANHAARVIQRAFRHYSMRRKFATITAMAKAERRLSRRFMGGADDWTSPSQQHQHQQASPAASLSSTSSAGVSPAGVVAPVAAADDAAYVIRCNFAALYRDLSQNVTRPPRTPLRSNSSGHHHHQQTPLSAPVTPPAHYQQYQQQHHQYGGAQYANYSGAPAVTPSAPVNYSAALYSSHTYLEQRRNNSIDSATVGLQLHNRSVSAGAVTPAAAAAAAKRVPPEVPRRTTSVLSGKSNDRTDSGNGTRSGASTPAASPAVCGATTTAAQQERRTSHLSEHSASEDSLENAGYVGSSVFWGSSSESTNTTVLQYPEPLHHRQRPRLRRQCRRRLPARPRSWRASASASTGSVSTCSIRNRSAESPT